MLRPKVDSRIVENLCSRLDSEGMLNRVKVMALIQSLKIKQENAPFYMFAQKSELKETIAALDYILKNSLPPDSLSG